MNTLKGLPKRRINALYRLQAQLTKGTKQVKFETVPLSDKDITRIKQEITNLKSK